MRKTFKKGVGLLLAAVFVFFSCGCNAVQKDSLSSDSYEQYRTELDAENAFNTGILTQKEQEVDQKLQTMKTAFIENHTDFQYTGLLNQDADMMDSPLYQFCKEMPKGSDLHLHGPALLPFEALYEVFQTNGHIMVGTEGESKYLLYLDTDTDRPENSMLLSEAIATGKLSREELRNHWTLLKYKQGEDIWDDFEGLFDKDAFIGDSSDLMKAYYEAAFRYYCQNNVKHLEIRVLLFGDHERAEESAKTIREAYYTIKEEYPDLVVSIVGTGLKRLVIAEEVTEQLLDNSLYVFEHVKDESDPAHITDFLVGIDLVGEEDKSRPLLFYKDKLLQIKEQYPDLKLLLHAGESLRTDNDNLMDAYLLGSYRIGHGLNLYRFPALMEKIIEDEICLEVCPVSNSLLGYVPDLRQHPAVSYLKKGVPMVLSSDDPAYQEECSLVDDYFVAILSWDLDLATVKQLCINSITYSAVDEEVKADMMQSFESDWDAFIQKYSI